MRILLTIAWRNIRQHKTKTLIIGAIMVIGIMVLMVGNSLMDTATAGIERYYTNNYTGHLMITGKTKGKLTLFGFQDMTAMEQAVPRIPSYEAIVDFARELPYVEAINPQVSGSAVVSLDDKMLMPVQLFGVVPDRYKEMFPANLEFSAGDFWKAEGEGVLLSKPLVDFLERRQEVTIGIGDKLLFTSVSTHTGMKIREVEVAGIFQFKQSNPQLDMVCLMDIANVRALAGMVVGTTTPADLSDSEQALLGRIDQDTIFGSPDSLFSDPEAATIVGDDYWYSFFSEGEVFGEAMIEEDRLIDAPADDGRVDRAPAHDAGAWQYLLIRLRDEKYLKRAQADFENFFDDKNIAAQSNNWLQGAGALAEMSYGIKNIFNGIVLVIAVVAIIIIMNTLVIAITERMGEIGTMRAIGAQKKFVRRMILLETLLLSGISGLLGILLGSMILFVLNHVGIKAGNFFFEIIFGGPFLRPELSLPSLVMSLLVVVLVGIVSSTYPTAIVMRTSPLQAMESRGD